MLHYRGGTINTMVLAGLAIALGEVVDDAIIDVENIVRRLRLNRAAAEPRSAFNVVLDASLEVRSAVVYATFIVVLVFIPVFFLEGLAGSFFRPLAMSYVLAVAASLAVALVVTPALCLLLLANADIAPRDAAVLAWLKARYRAWLPAVVGRPRAAVAALGVLFALTIGAASLLGEEFMPKFKEYDFLMHWVEKPGTSLEAMQRITVRASRELRAIPGVRNFGAHIGRAEVADEVVGPNFTELWISLDPSAALRVVPRQDPEGGRRLPGPLPGRADLPQGADQGGADRRQRRDCRPRVRPRARSAAPDRRGAGQGARGHRGRVRSAGGAAGAGARGPGPPAPGGCAAPSA